MVTDRILEAPALREAPRLVTSTLPIYGALTNLPPFQPVVVTLMQMFGRDDVGAIEIARLIEADPSLASEVLTLANSPQFGLASSVVNLTHAITVLGLERVRTLSAVIAMRAMMDGAPKSSSLRRCWRHSIACALIARELAPAYNVPGEQAYTAGVLHDVGRCGLMATHPDKYSRLCCIMCESPRDILSTETSWFKINHCQAGRFLAASWRLPEFFRGVVSLHHHRSRGEGIVPLTQVSCLMADSIGMDAIHYKLPKPEAVMTLLPEDARQNFASKLKGIEPAVVDAIEAFDFSPAGLTHQTPPEVDWWRLWTARTQRASRGAGPENCILHLLLASVVHHDELKAELRALPAALLPARLMSLLRSITPSGSRYAPVLVSALRL